MWTIGDPYEAYMGRWSRRLAVAFVDWLAAPAGRRWLDVGCGTGALTAAILARAEPAQVVGVDTSEGFLAYAGTGIVGDAQSLPLPDDAVDVAVSGLALNFVTDPQRAAAELVRVTAPGGLVSAYVWDYGDGMAMLRHFWDAATALDPAAADLDEGRRFPLCQPHPLRRLWTDAGLAGVTVEAIEVPTVFAHFDDFWMPFLGGQGLAPAYLMSLPEDRRAALRDLLRARLPAAADGSIPLAARAWAVQGLIP